MIIFLFIVGFAAVLVTGLSVLKRDAWWIRIFDFPRVLITVIAITVLIAFLPWWNRNDPMHNLYIFLLGISVAYQLILMLPYTPLWKKQVKSATKEHAENRVSLLVTNILMTNRSPDAYRRLLETHDPDIHIIIEADDWWMNELTDLGQRYPHRVLHPMDNTYGLLLYSKIPLEDTRVQFLAEKDVPSIHGIIRLSDQHRIQFHCVHPRPPAQGKHMDTTHRDAELLLVAKAVKTSDLPALVLGDFNDVAWSHTTRLFQRISGLRDPRIGRGLYSTFHTKYPLLRFPLDHIFHSGEFQLVNFHRCQYIGSDHFPLFATLQFTESFTTEETEIESLQSEHQADHQEANRKIEKSEILNDIILT